MKKIILLLFLFHPFFLSAQSPLAVWEKQARAVTVVRDKWGIPHVFGKTDADCVFGIMYAQCEDDFPRIEMNYVEKLGRMAELKGEAAIYDDLMNRLVIDSAAAMGDYRRAPAWLKKLLDAFAAGINYFLYRHPETKPALLHHFEPWYPLLWTDGSIGAISTAGISVRDLKEFYGGTGAAVTSRDPEEEDPTGSNGFAIAPSRSAGGHAMLYINPHVDFYFRPELHMVSEEGLDAYGAATWGQFFIYQGFNAHCGWMHTSSAVDVADLYVEQILKKGDSLFYRYEQKEKPVISKDILIRWLGPDGMHVQKVHAFFTHHGPVMASRNGHWLTLKAVNRSMDGLIQSWLRTKAKDFAGFKQVMNIRSNTSNNTVYADDKGNIAYWHGNFIPVRDKHFDWSRPVDGSVAATEWKGLHKVDETVHIYNPPNGWLQNCNSTPFTAAGAYSPDRNQFPVYMAPDGENFRGINAVRVLDREKQFTLDKLIQAGYDNYLTAFETLVPALLGAYDKAAATGDTLSTVLRSPIAVLRAWDMRCSVLSVATTLAVEWGQRLMPKIIRYSTDHAGGDQVAATHAFVKMATPAELLEPLRDAVQKLQDSFGKWEVPWGDLNRYQRPDGNIISLFRDAEPSLPVGWTYSAWGCLPSFASRYVPGNRLRYGVAGNSFVCAVEFGKKIRARSLLTGGESGHPDSRHFADQAVMYTEGKFKDVLFYKEDILRKPERTYHPGE